MGGQTLHLVVEMQTLLAKPHSQRKRDSIPLCAISNILLLSTEWEVTLLQQCSGPLRDNDPP